MTILFRKLDYEINLSSMCIVVIRAFPRSGQSIFLLKDKWMLIPPKCLFSLRTSSCSGHTFKAFAYNDAFCVGSKVYPSPELSHFCLQLSHICEKEKSCGILCISDITNTSAMLALTANNYLCRRNDQPDLNTLVTPVYLRIVWISHLYQVQHTLNICHSDLDAFSLCTNSLCWKFHVLRASLYTVSWVMMKIKTHCVWFCNTIQ